MNSPNDIRIQHLGGVAAGALRLSTTEYSDHQFGKHFHSHYTILLVEAGVQ